MHFKMDSMTKISQTNDIFVSMEYNICFTAIHIFPFQTILSRLPLWLYFPSYGVIDKIANVA